MLCDVEDADALYAEYAAQDVEFARGLGNMPWREREFVVKDCDGRLLAFGAKAVASYIGMIPREHSSGGRQRFGRISKQGNSLLRFLWGEAAIHAVRRDPELRHFYRRKLVQKGMGKARVAAARKLGIRLWIMLRDEIDYREFCRRGQLRRQCSNAVRAGMPAGDSGPN